MASGFSSPGGLFRFIDGSYGRGAEYRGRSYNIQDSVDWLRGAHSIKAGIEYRAIRLPFQLMGGTRFFFNNDDTFINNEDVDALFQGDLTFRVAQQEQYAAYVQDEWRVSSKLTRCAPTSLRSPVSATSRARRSTAPATVTRSIGTPSSSATTCAKVVSCP